MGFFDIFSRKVTRQLQTTFYNYGTTEVYTHIDTEKAISEGYNGNSAVYAIVNKDANKFGAIPVYLYKKATNENEDDEIIEDGDLVDLINMPNSYQGQDAFRALARVYRVLTGEVFIRLNRGESPTMAEYNQNLVKKGKDRMKMPVLEMTVLPTDHVTIIPDPTDLWGSLGYYLEVNGQKQFFPKEDIVHWKNPSLDFDGATRTHLRGQSPLSSGYKSLQQNNDATAASVRMYQNDGAKGLVYNEELGSLSPTGESQLRGVINKKINNSDAKGSVAYMQGKWGYVDMGGSSVDMKLLEGKEMSMKELCFLFDVPYTLFDPNTAFANSEWQQKNWILNSIIPACKQLDDELNRVLLPAFGMDATAFIASDFTDLPELQEDMSGKITSLLAAPVTPNEIREAAGYDPIPSPEMDEVWVDGSKTPLSQLNDGMDDIANQLNNNNLL